MSAWYPESGATKEVFVKHNSQENICDILEPGDNGDVIGFDKESVDNVGGINV